MARSLRRFTDADYLGPYDGIPNEQYIDATRVEVEEVGLGYYQRLSLEDVINNFIVSHIGEGKVLTKVPRPEVAFWAQRAVQEFSYDIFHADNNIEVELNPNTLQIPLPQDFVSLVKITYTGNDGREYTALPAQNIRAKQAILQDDTYEYNYDSQGELLYAAQDEGTLRWQDEDTQGIRNIATSYYNSANYDSDYDYYTYYSYQGRRYGIEPRFHNRNGEYVLDLVNGIIYFGSGFAQDAPTSRDDNEGEHGWLVNIRYISDGLAEGGDLATVYVPKLAEDAIYASILYNLAKIRPSAAGAAGLYKKEASAKMRNAKIRLTNYKIEEMTQVFRGKAKWIKH